MISGQVTFLILVWYNVINGQRFLRDYACEAWPPSYYGGNWNFAFYLVIGKCFILALHHRLTPLEELSASDLCESHIFAAMTQNSIFQHAEGKPASNQGSPSILLPLSAVMSSPCSSSTSQPVLKTLASSPSSSPQAHYHPGGLESATRLSVVNTPLLEWER